MIVQPFVLSAFQQNTRVVACKESLSAICIDPGADSTEIVDFIRSGGFQLKAVALTHGHLDHVGGTSYLKEKFPEAEIILHQDDEDLYYGLPQQPLLMGIPSHQLSALGFDYLPPPRLTRNWEHGETFAVGSLRFQILHCPGHTKGHIVLAEPVHKRVFVGDCLFAGSIGRTDLPGGSYEQLIASIENNLLTLGDDFTVYSGHGPETTIGRERSTNPFLNGNESNGRGRWM